MATTITLQQKQIYLWIVPVLSSGLAILSLWLLWTVVEIQPTNNFPNQASRTQNVFQDETPLYEPDKLTIAVWPSESQERFFQTAAKAARRRWLAAIPFLLSLYCLYIHVLKLWRFL